MAVVLVTAPAVMPVSTVDAKRHLRVDIADDDALIETLVAAATAWVETITRRALVTQTWDLALDAWPAGGRINVPKAPLQSVTSVTAYDRDGGSAVFAGSNYLVDTDGQPGAVVLRSGASWPSAELREVNGVRVRFVAGYGDPEDVPAPITEAILLAIGTMYENREDVQVAQGISVTALPFGIRRLLAPYRLWT